MNGCHFVLKFVIKASQGISKTSGIRVAKCHNVKKLSENHTLKEDLAMSLTKRIDSDVMFPSFSSLLDELMSDTLPRTGASSPKLVPAVNILETENEFILEVAAPGLRKENFNLHVEQKRLSISAQADETKQEGKYIRREFNYYSFKRVFALPDFVNIEAIQASYQDGILRISIAKREEVKPRSIQIS
jgi:HSP20 family protein